MTPAQWDELPDMLKPEQAWPILRISRNTFYEAALAGEIPALKIRGSWRVPKAALQRYLGILADPQPEPLPVPASPRRVRRKAPHLRLAPGGAVHSRKSPRRTA